MKTILLSVILSLTSVSLFAKGTTIVPSEHSIAPSSIDKMIRLVDKTDAGSSHKKLSIIVEDKGLSTDVSPRYSVYLGYASLAEMGNLSANYLINTEVIKFLSATRKAPGIYEIKVIEYRTEGMVEVTQILDTTKMFAEEQAIRKACGGDFCDTSLKSAIVVTETTKK